MPPTIISKKASNWVDRGDPANPTIERILGRFLDRNPADELEWFHEESRILAGMVEADATEVHVARYIRTLLGDPPSPDRDGASIRLAGIAIWHVAKAALVRDFAERVLQGEVPVNEPTPDSVGHWIASRLLSPEELATFERDARNTDLDE